MFSFGMFELIVIAIYILVIVFLIWLTFRFVKAHESLAEGIQHLADILKNKNEGDNPL